MDFQRIILWLGIGAISLMLVTEWQSFKQFKAEQAEAAQEAMIAEDNPTISDSNLPSVESVPVASENSVGDVPQIDVPSASPETASEPRAQLIRVRSQVLDVTIDPLGGDIVGVKLLQHLKDLDKPDEPLTMLARNRQHTYVAQSGLIGPNATDSNKGRPRFFADKTEYTVESGSINVDLVHRDENGVLITKRFVFEADSYLINQQYLINNLSDQPWKAALFGQIKRDSSKDPNTESSAMGMQPFLGVATTTEDENYKKLDFEDIAESRFESKITGGWIAMSQHYFVSAWIPDAKATNSYSVFSNNQGMNFARFTSAFVDVAPQSTGTIEALFYVGPKDQYTLADISEYLDLTIDYGWLWWIAKPLFWLMVKIHSLVGNWGWTIILLTIVIKGLFFHLSATSYKSMANMRRVQPKMVEIKERYADDRQKQSQLMMDLYKKEKINPLGGCLPILVQMPVFIALYWVLMESVEIRHAPWIGYIKDLSTMDPYFILPLIMGASMYFMQKLNPPPTDPMQAKIMQWMPVMFTFLFLWFPSGLVLYWVVNNLLSMAQQYVITKRMGALDP